MSTLCDKCGRFAFLASLLIQGFAGICAPATAVLPAAARVTIASLRNSKAVSRGPGVTVRGVVTAFSGWKNSFFLQDDTGAISVDRTEQTPVQVGDRVQIAGTTGPGLFAPVLISHSIEVLEHLRNLPSAQAASYLELANGGLDSKRVEITGVIHSAHIEDVWGKPVLLLDLHTLDRGRLTVYVGSFSKDDLGELVDSTVIVRGVCGTVFNNRQQLLGVRLFVGSLGEITTELEPVPIVHLPLLTLSDLLRYNPNSSIEHRVKIEGTVTYEVPGSGFYLQSNGLGIRVETSQTEAFPVGSKVEVAGFATTESYGAKLENALARVTGPSAPVSPIPVRARQIIATKDGFIFAPYDGLLVQIDGKVVERLPQTQSQLWLVEDHKVRFQAELLENNPNDGRIEPGSVVHLTGVCRVESDSRGNPSSFRILLRSEHDISVRHTAYSTVPIPAVALVLALLLVGGLAIIWFQHGPPSPVLPVPAPAPLSSSRSALFATVSKTMALLAGGIGVLVLFGWAANISFLKSIRPDYPTMKPNAAAALVSAAVSLWLATSGQLKRYRLLAHGCALLSAGIGGLTLVEYVSGWNLHIDELLFREAGILQSTSSPGRMALVIAFSFVLLGCALLVVHHPRFTSVAQALALVTGAFCLLSLNAYIYGIHEFEGISVYVATAVHTSVGVLLLSLGLLISYPGRGPMRSISSLAPGGVMAIRLVPSVLLAPSILGWIRWQGQLHGLYDTAFGLALFTSVNAVCFTFLIWTTASLLNRLDDIRSKAEAEVRSLNENLESRVAERTLELQSTEQRFRATIEAVKDYSIITLDPQGNVASWNAGAERQKGYRAEEIVGKHISAFYSDEDHRAGLPEKELALAIKTGEFFREGWRRRKDGSMFWASILLTPVLSPGGTLRGFSKITQDITNRKRTETALHEANELLELRVKELAESNKELARKNEEVEAFVYIVSHDLRAPLVNLQGFSKEMEMCCEELCGLLLPVVSSSNGANPGLANAEKLLTAEIPACLRYIASSATKFQRLIDALLELSRHGRKAHHVESIDLSALIQNTLDFMRLSIAASGAQISVLPIPKVQGDATAVGQVFSNLIGNSLKYLQPGRPGKIEIGAATEDGIAHCWVRDNGAGLPAVSRARLFQVFQRFHPNLAEGEGMGLAIVKRIIERHGGNIWAEGEEGVGTTFHFTLPGDSV